MGSVSWTTRWMCLKISNHSFFSKLSSVWRMMSLILDKPSLDYIVKVAPKKREYNLAANYFLSLSYAEALINNWLFI